MLLVAEQKRYAQAVNSRLAKLKSEYGGYRKSLKATGNGVDEETDRSKIEQVAVDWPWWYRLHAMWSELPNYNPVGVINSKAGVDHGAEAAAIFAATDGVDPDEVQGSPEWEDLDETETAAAVAVTAEDDTISLPSHADIGVPHARPATSVAGPHTTTVSTPVPSASSMAVSKEKGKPTTILNPRSNPLVTHKRKVSLANADFVVQHAADTAMLTAKRQLAADERKENSERKARTKLAELKMRLDHQATESSKNREFELQKLRLAHGIHGFTLAALPQQAAPDLARASPFNWDLLEADFGYQPM
jgi:hypothetical protein